MDTLRFVVNFVLKSSADPRKVSLTVKAALIGIIPLLMQVSGIVCQLGHICIEVDPTLLEQVGNGLAELVFLILSAVSVIGMLYGAIRKVIRTMNGENLALTE